MFSFSASSRAIRTCPGLYAPRRCSEPLVYAYSKYPKTVCKLNLCAGSRLLLIVTAKQWRPIGVAVYHNKPFPLVSVKTMAVWI